MQQTLHQPGVTFRVDEVTPATKPLPECRTHEAVRDMLGAIESCCDYHGMVVKGLRYQPLLAAVYTAFSEHRPLTLSPDAVWLTITQGVAHHMTIHSERLRSRFVAHQGRLDLVFQCRDWVEGSPENPWPDAFATWAGQIRDHVGAQVHDALVCDFSTTGPLERAASQIVMMDVFERYFHYVALGICGIPTVTLEGTPADWQRLADKAAALRVFNLYWWLEHLLPICAQFVRASRGDVDLEHWQNICKLREEYGGDIINGWVAKLFPYLRAFTNGPCNRRNPIFDTGQGFTTSDAPPGLSRVPFTWRNATTGVERRMEAMGGLLGVTQDPETLALRPKVGWAVRAAGKMDVLLARLAEHRTFRGKRKDDRRNYLPSDLARFYHHTEGAELFGRGTAAAFRIMPVCDLERLDWGEVSEKLRDNDYPNGHIWYRLAWLADGSWLAINTAPELPEALREQYLRDCRELDIRRWDTMVAICHCHKDTIGRPGANPVVALSFTELLERLLDSGGRPFWLEPEFVGYGDAEQYTRRR
ncbi:MAG: DUF4419 domain-containing protein [Gemmataceae bacterium]|nr:DUF4419 domain-containing protein [Gemmataceae bacterium]